ncbi:MAG: hypothetical protein VXW35_05770, partial [Actinomycetota bacterium]|nr:hypothetical protein [Actinomycetota bacterium]
VTKITVPSTDKFFKSPIAVSTPIVHQLCNRCNWLSGTFTFSALRVTVEDRRVHESIATTFRRIAG